MKSQSPILEFKEHNVTIRLSLSNLYNQIVTSIQYESHIVCVCSKHFITHALQNYEIPDINDALILGSLCEALCKAGVTINLLLQNESLINQFVKEALLYCNCSLKDYQFDPFRALSLLSVKTDGTFLNATKSFRLLEQTDNYAVSIIALLHVHRQCIAVGSQNLVQHFIDIPKSIASINLELEILNHIYDAIIWVLLEKSEFYLDKNNSFYHAKFNSKQELKLYSFFFFPVFNPLKENQLF